MNLAIPLRRSSTAAKAIVYADAPPLATHGYCATDLTSLRIFALCAVPLGGLKVQQTSDAKFFRFLIPSELRWPDSTRVTGHDYLRAIHRMMNTPGLRFRSLFSDVVGYKALLTGQVDTFAGIEAEDDSISFNLRFANRLFTDLLCFSSVSPIHETELNWSAGPYRLEHRNDASVKLVAQRDTPCVKEIHFDLECKKEDPFAIDRYLSGNVDVTCDTFFPHERLREFQDRTDFSFTDTRIFVYLSSQGCETDLDDKVLHIFNHCVSREWLSKKLNHSAEPWTGFSSAPLAREDLRLASETTIDIAYEDFAPNRQILDELATVLKERGIRINAVKTAYGERLSRCALRLELFVNPLSDPLLFYRSMGSRPKVHRDPRKSAIYAELLSRYQFETNRNRNDLRRSLDLFLLDLGLFVPLLALKGMELKQPGLQHFGFRPNHLWSWLDVALPAHSPLSC